MASLIGLSASQSQILYRCSPPAFISSSAHSRQAPVRRLLVLPLKCLSSGPSHDTKSEAKRHRPVLRLPLFHSLRAIPRIIGVRGLVPSGSLKSCARRSWLGLKVTLVMLHLIYAAILFLFDSDLIVKTKKEPWYTALYLLLFFATLVQYFITSGSSPRYVLDAMSAVNETNVIYKKSSMVSKQPASSKNGSLIVTVEGSQSGRNFQGSNSASWTKLVMDMYPPGTSVRTCTCSYCNVEQPPRAKHCHDCDKCVLQFDHHCVWLGTCIGQGNHCKFWWYICEETALCLWTGILYITYLKANISRAWWKDAIMILLLIALSSSIIFLLLLLLFHSYLVLTNQTTYELVRRRRIPYLRGIPERVYPFSKGVCSNLYDFCRVGSSIYSLETLPSAQELEEKSRPYTCLDVLTCRCC